MENKHFIYDNGLKDFAKDSTGELLFLCTIVLNNILVLFKLFIYSIQIFIKKEIKEINNKRNISSYHIFGLIKKILYLKTCYLASK